ncbi:hypothetical protein XELAEV_18039630mg [Xenopus laevis]|uniref:Protein kintoun n=1 Tax=Xenopus laevis TaxID=8355 RepID=A0A974C920_XENLA|nr:hypothetical protein XELAEV_18039630mg [Xenopus laevis]
MAEKLQNLELSSEELDRFTKAFQDPKFREMFVQYAEEIRDPENRRKYEQEISQMESERGMDIKFIHPKPGYVLLTSVNGVQKCYLNICSNDLLQKPECKPGKDGEGKAGLHWSLPYSLSAGREDLGKDGSKHVIYDVVFHPDTLHIASKNEKFKMIVDSTSLEAVASQFDVKLDKANVRTLSMKYKGVPNPSVLRKPLLGTTPKHGDPEDPLSFPYPYDVPTAVGKEKKDQKRVIKEEHKQHVTTSEQDPDIQIATTPNYTVRHRSYVDLQDFRDSRDSTPSPVPKELVITVDLPLLNSAESVNLHIAGKNLSLESEKPAYKLNVKLPYVVEDNQGKAQFNKARRQLIITVPVIQHNILTLMQDHFEEARGEKDLRGAESSVLHEEYTDNGSRTSACGTENKLEPLISCLNEEENNSEGLTSESNLDTGAPYLPEISPNQNTLDREEVVYGLTEDVPSMPSDTLVCPTFSCSQDPTSLTLIAHVRDIDENSISTDVGSNHYHIRCSVKQSTSSYDLLVTFLPHDIINPNEVYVNISENNALIGLTKSPESVGFWKMLYFGVSGQPLQERRFVSEDNINEVLACSIPLSQVSPSTQEHQPLIEVLEMTDERTHIRINKPKTECVVSAEHKEHCTDHSEHERDVGVERSNIAVGDTTEHYSNQVSPCRENTELDRDHTSERYEEPESTSCTGESTSDQQQKDSNLVFPGDSSAENKMACLKSSEQTTQESDLAEDDMPDRSDHTQNFDSRPASSSVLKEIGKKDGSVQVIRDHTTQCPFQFQNSLLFDLD